MQIVPFFINGWHLIADFPYEQNHKHYCNATFFIYYIGFRNVVQRINYPI